MIPKITFYNSQQHLLYYVWYFEFFLWITVQLSVNQSNSLYLVEQNGFQNTLTTTSCTFIVVNDIKELIH